MSAIENAKKHFKEQYESKSFCVPEWGDENLPLRIFVEPLTLKQKQEYVKVIESKGQIEGILHLVLTKALDGDGKRIFYGEQLVLKNQVDPKVLEKVGLTILRLSTGLEADDDLVYDVDELKKN